MNRFEISSLDRWKAPHRVGQSMYVVACVQWLGPVGGDGGEQNMYARGGGVYFYMLLSI